VNDYEIAFDDFFHQKECAQVEDALFAIMQISFKAGWIAAGGKISKPLSSESTQKDEL